MISSARRLLIVDDNVASCKMLRRCLEDAGYEVQITTRGSEGVRLAREAAFDLVLLDIEMPEMDGWETLRRIREFRSPTELPIVMATGRDEGDDVARALRDGANDYVTKPIDLTVAAARIETQLSLKGAVDRIVMLQESLEKRNEALTAANDKMKRDLESAARLQRALLPNSPPRVEGISFAWHFQPCDELGGDVFNVFHFGPTFIAFYVLDVSGHGVPAALLSVTLSRLLSPIPVNSSLVHRTDERGEIVPVPPVELAMELNRRFATTIDSEQYFTLLYALLDVRAREIRFVSAGHPGPTLVRSADAVDLTKASLPIGLDDSPGYEERRISLQPGDRLYLYSDGISEARNAHGELFGQEGVLGALRSAVHDDLQASVAGLVQAAGQWSTAVFHDDVSVLALELSAKL